MLAVILIVGLIITLGFLDKERHKKLDENGDDK